jgi:hypothetical protein
MNFLSTAICGLALGTALSLAQAADTIDQLNAVNNFAYVNLTTPQNAQSFQPAVGNVSGAGFYVTSAAGSLAVSLWMVFPNSNLLGLLATGTAPISVPTGWVDVSWAPVTVIPENTYFLTFQPMGGTTGIVIGGTVVGDNYLGRSTTTILAG